MLLVGILLGLVVTLITYIILLTTKRLNHWRLAGVPFEKPHWFLGNLTGMRTERSLPDIWLEYYNRFKGSGPFAGFYWFTHPSVFVLDPELIKSIMIKDFNKFMDRGLYHNEVDDPLTGHLFFLDGLKWKTLRQKITPTFSSGKMSQMFPVMKRLGQQMTEVLEEKINETAISEETEKGVIEIKDLLARFGADVIGSCAFGIECNSLTNSDVQFHIMGKRLFSEPRHGNFIMAMVITFPEFMKKLRIKTIPDAITNFFMNLVKETVKAREGSSVKRNDFLEMLLDLKESKQIKTEDGEEMKSLTIEEIAAQMVLFFIAGYETSTTTVGFALYELALHEDIQERLRQEVTQIWKQNNREIDYESIKEMSYLQQVLQETMRLYTVVPILNRQCLEDYQVPGHPNYIIKKGMNVFIPSYPIHKDEQYYENPNEFNPDNFLPSKCKERDSILFLPFGDGPRNCIGQRFGEMQTRLALAMLVKNFKFSVSKQTQVPMTFDKTTFFLGSENGIYLKVEKILE